MRFVLLFILVFPLWAELPDYVIKNVKDIKEIVAGGGYIVKEVVHPKNDPVNSGFSIAYIKLPPGKSTKPHYLKSSSQVFYILKGSAIFHIGSDVKRVSEGMAIYLAPGVIQWAENKGETEFEFICVVSPPWRADDEVVK